MDSGRNLGLDIFGQKVFSLHPEVIARFGLVKNKVMHFDTEGDIKDLVSEVFTKSFTLQQENIADFSEDFKSIPKEELEKITAKYKVFIEEVLETWLEEYQESGLIPDLQKVYVMMYNYSPQVMLQSNLWLLKIKGEIFLEFLNETLLKLRKKFET